MSLYWLEPGWTDALCMECGVKIWPEGDPDWGRCYNCFTRHLESQHQQTHPATPSSDME